MESVKTQWDRNREAAVDSAEASYIQIGDIVEACEHDVEYYSVQIMPTPTGWAANMREGIRKLKEAAKYFEEASKLL